MKPTPEQEAIVAAHRDGGHIAVRALAGTGKTSTLVRIADAATTPILSIAFNKRNADELRERMPSHVECATMHSVGFRACKKWLGHCSVEKGEKKARILREEIEKLSGNDKTEAYTNFADILSAIKDGASAGWVPQDFGVHPLLSDEEFLSTLDFAPSNLEWRLIRRVTALGLTTALKERKFDFDDMVLIPALWPVSLPSYPRTMVDEAQDLSALNHLLVRRLVGKNELTIVGDPFQAIYAFRGAHETSMDLLRAEYEMQVCPLTVAFRCPRAVIEHVQWRAPDMQPTPWAKEGSVSTLTRWSDSDLPDGAFVICRNNAPVFRLAINLLRAGRKPKVLGNDITRGIIKTLKKISPDLRLSSEKALEEFQPEAERLRRRYRDSKTIEDKIACIEHFLEDQPTLGLAIRRAEQIMEADGSISLMTGHKSKGLEADNVFFLDEHLVKDEGQDRNLRYVICTRSKDTLTYVTTEGFEQ